MSVTVTGDGPNIALSGTGSSITITVTTGSSGGGGGVTDHGALTGLADDDHTQYAKKASNLSDLTSASTARTNLGLGTAATADTGTGSANVILGNDSRLTDARTPTAHTHGAADVTSGTFDAARIPDLAASKITSGTFAIGRLASGTPDGTKFVRDDGTLAVPTASETLGASIIDAKGDLIAGSAADTPVRVAVGADRRVLRAASGETPGVKWSLPDLTQPAPSGLYTSGSFAAVTTTAYTTQSSSANFILCSLIWTEPDRIIDRLGVVVTSGASGGTARLALHRMDGTNGWPGTQIVTHSGTLDSSTNGLKAATVSVPGEGWVWAIFQSGGATVTYRSQVTAHTFPPLTSPDSSATRYDSAYNARSDAAIPSDLTSQSFGTLAQGFHFMMIRYA